MQDSETSRPPQQIRSMAIDGARLIGRRVSWYASLASTMDQAVSELRAGGPEGLAVVADEQTAGRGRLQRPWYGEAGKDVPLSVALSPTPGELPQLAALAGLAVSNAVNVLAGVASTIKWPNDVRVDGRKVAGVLVETCSEGDATIAAIGVGLNVGLNPQDYPEIAETATSLGALGGDRVTRDLAVEMVLREMDALYTRLATDVPIIDEWSERLDTLGKRVALTFGDAVLHGTAVATDAEGALILECEDGTRETVRAGEVTSQV